MRFIESICFKDGEYHNLSYHQERLNGTFDRFMPEIESHDLKMVLPDLKLEGTYKVRIVYDADAEDADYDLEFSEYIPRSIQTLEVVETKRFDYAYKYEDRSKINRLVKNCTADDIIIAIKGMITDSSYANLAFWDGTEWLTPENPLLKGVRRSQLLAEGKIKEAPIRVSDLGAFEKVSLINAMLDLGEVQILIEKILK